MPPNKENTLYLPIKQVYFDEIIAGTKDKEYREIKDTTAGKYLIETEKGQYKLNEKVTHPDQQYYIDDYNNGKFPFVPRPYQYLHLAVGYSKERDTALVEVTDYSFEPEMIRNNLYAFWVIVYHLGKVVELKQKQR